MRRWLFLLRAFFPSWKLFDQIGSELVLEARSGASAESLSDWRGCLPPIRRSFANLFVNPRGNFLHACHNLLNHLSSDIASSPDVSECASYRITKNLVLSRVPDRVYQFRLLAVGEHDPEVLLLSPVEERT